MLRHILSALLLACVLLPAADSDDVLESSGGWRRAVLQQDKAALERLLAPDLVYAHSNGKTESKAVYIASVTTGPGRYESFVDTDTKVRVYGKAAILEAEVEVKPVGRPSYRVRTLEVYVKNGTQWQMTAHQSARINP